MTTLVFLGPSLPHARARAILPAARFLPPAARGDIYRAARDLAPRAILLIDGVFHRRRAVWHREILWALSRGIAVFGAASMGALRAAELAAYGMRGIGRIHGAYAAGRLAPFDDAFDDDAEVAVAHGPDELGAQPLTVALVDLRCLFADAMTAGSITPTQCRDLVARCAAIFFAERTPDSVRDVIATADLAEDARAMLAARLADPAHATKRADAIAALEAVARAEHEAAAAPCFAFTPALVWERFRRTADGETDFDAAALDELRLLPDAWAAWRVRVDDDGALLALLAAEGALAPLRARAARKHALLGTATPAAIGEARALRLLAWFRRRVAGDGFAQPGAAALLAASGCADEASLLRLVDRELRFVEEAARRGETP